MRVFVLSTGRCGSTTLFKALSHTTNYTCAHESRSNRAQNRLDYPDRHIEVDNRLSWFLGSLHRRYPKDFYVWLRRDREAVVRSYMKRFGTQAGIMSAFARGIIQGSRPVSETRKRTVAELYVDTVEDNIATFLAYVEPRQVVVEMDHSPQDDLERLWDAIGAEGDLDTALTELTRKYNAS